MKTIVMTGGGSAGHVTPNLALIPQLKSGGFAIHYIGQKDSIEERLIKSVPDVEFHAISAGKLRRYFSVKNLSDPFKVVKGMFQSRRLMREIKPDIVFSKGGFVSVPVVVAAYSRHIPVVTHESDYTPGLANKINARFASRICVTFSDTLTAVGRKGVHTGTPIRPELYDGDKQRGLEFLGFSANKPLLLCMGGSLGAHALNMALRESLDLLLDTFNVCHICGEGKVDEAYFQRQGYRQFEYISKELPDVFAAADLVLSRAGANSVFEFLALSKPALLVPLPLTASRGDQILNAGYFARKGYSMVLEQERLSKRTLVDAVTHLYAERLSYIAVMSADPLADGTDEIINVIMQEYEKTAIKVK